MSEKPILFSGPMIRALLDGRKTQTRRVVTHKYEALKKAPYYPTGKVLTNLERQPGAFMEYRYEGQAYDYAAALVPCPYGQPGDRLWVRETFFAYGRWETRYSPKKGRDEWHFVDMTIECDRAYQYVVESNEVPLARDRGGVTPGWWKRPAIFMPRWASRILLEITGVRVERLQDISYEDALTEGIVDWAKFCRGEPANEAGESSEQIARRLHWPQREYEHLWDSLKPPAAHAWDANPWVWVVEFKRVTAGGKTT